MPYVYVEPDIFLEHRDIVVFHTYRSGTNETWEYWFTTDESNADETCAHGSDGHFDARMFTGLWSQTPTVDQWEDWWKHRFKTEDDAVKALIRSAIDDGKVKTITD